MQTPSTSSASMCKHSQHATTTRKHVVRPQSYVSFAHDLFTRVHHTSCEDFEFRVFCNRERKTLSLLRIPVAQFDSSTASENICNSICAPYCNCINQPIETLFGQHAKRYAFMSYYQLPSGGIAGTVAVMSSGCVFREISPVVQRRGPPRFVCEHSQHVNGTKVRK